MMLDGDEVRDGDAGVERSARAEEERCRACELLLLPRRRGSEARDLAVETDMRAPSSSGTVEDDGDRDCGRRRRSLGGGAWRGAREESEEELGVEAPARSEGGARMSSVAGAHLR